MQKANCVVRLGGSLTNTVPKLGVTPAEVLVLQHIHGSDAVVDIRPTPDDKRIRPEAEFERLRSVYDGGNSFVSKPGEQQKSIMDSLFPGAMKRLPMTFDEIGLGIGGPAAAPPPPPPAVDEDETDLPDGDVDDLATGEGGEGDGAAEGAAQGSAEAE